MTKKELIRRYLIFTAGLVFTSFGIAFTTKSGLGTSPISAIPYSLSLILPEWSMGKWTILFSLLLILIQLVLQRRRAKKAELLLQLIVTAPFGYLIDLGIFCLSPFEPQSYPMRLLFLLIGCFVVAFGVYFQVVANVVMLSGDAFVRAVAGVMDKEFGRIRMVSDIAMTAIALLLCLIFLGGLRGVREGTVMAAIFVGNIVRLYDKRLARLKEWLVGWESNGS